MANWLAKLRQTLDRYPDSFHHTSELFPRLDAERWSEDLRLEAQGSERGSANQPATSATQPDAVELALRTRIEDLRKQAIDLANERLSALEERKARLGILSRSEELWLAAEDAGADFRAAVQGDLSHFFFIEDQARDHHRHLDNFRAGNGLDRPARKQGSSILKIGVLFIIGLFEIFMNLVFFAEGSALFLIGGAIEAALVTIINIGVAWCIGRVVLTRVLNGRWGARLTTFPFFCAWLAFLVGFNLAVGHYRDMLSGDNFEQAAHLAWLQFLNAPFGIADFQSWLLWALGVFAGIVALADGYFFDDPFPGYGRFYRDYQAVVGKWAEERYHFIDRLTERKDDALDALKSASSDLERRRESFASITASIGRHLTQYDAYMDHLEACYQQLVETYRSANKRARSTEEPIYFRDPPRLPRMVLAVDHDRTNLDRVEEETKRAAQALRQAGERVITEFDSAISGLQSVENVLRDPGRPQPQRLRRAA